jgi:cell division protein YceG involved in septum cleavage
MKTRLITFVIALFLATAVSVQAQTLDQAARQAAKQHDAKVLSARTVKEGNRDVHVIKLLTKNGVVKTVRVPVRKR